MMEAIEGPDCINPSNCRGACCSIKIDVPKVLAKEYIRRGLASKSDFIRSDVFSFQLRLDEISSKCFLFDKSINGCKVHNLGIKPPQCWVYPTGFSNSQTGEIKCKKLGGWRIIDPQKTNKAENLLNKYNFLCQIEAKKEIRKINKRLNRKERRKKSKSIISLLDLIKNVAPCKLGGFKDMWDSFQILSAEGLSLQMRKFCLKYNSSCAFLPDDFFECRFICDKVAEELIQYFSRYLYQYINKYGPDTDGEYPLYKFFNYIKIE